jgi:sialidase-1
MDGRAGRFGARENLTVRLSLDGGVTWPHARTLDPGVAGYSDLTAGPDGSIFCLYEGGKSESGGFPWIALTRFNREWVTGRSSNEA